MKYKSVSVTRRGGPEALQVVENDLRLPASGEAQIRILASPVVQDDIAVRVGNRPVLAKIPFTPGYSILGEVSATGAGVTHLAAGQRVAALTNFGGWAEYIILAAEKLVRVPDGLDPAQAVALVLNYLVAYQCLHRVAQAKAGDTALVVGASGGCGTAFLDLGRLAGVKMYGLASAAKQELVRSLGGIPMDYRSQDFVELLRQAEPGGLDFVFNGMADEYFKPGLAVLRRGGALVHFGGPQSFWGLWRLVGRLLLYNLLPDGKKVKGYGTHREGLERMQQDWATLFDLLGQGQIHPLIAARFPLLQARAACELFESGRFAGNIVLLAPELL